MSKHTPGPWTIAYRPSSGFGCGYGRSQIIGADGQPIAGVAAVDPKPEPMYDNGGLSRATLDLVEANARLMAASPDLLEACKVAAAVMRAGAAQLGHGRVRL